MKITSLIAALVATAALTAFGQRAWFKTSSTARRKQGKLKTDSKQ
jgi:hypothetical protein